MAATAVVARADLGRARVLLGLSAPGQPRARTSWPPTRSIRRCIAAGDATDLLHDFGTRGADRRAADGLSVELRARPRPHPAGDARQPVQPGGHPGPPGDAAGRRVELVPRPGPRRLRPPRRRLVAALADAARHPPPRGVERAHRRLAAPAGGGRGPRRSGGPSTSSTGRRSAGRSTRWASCSAGSARVGPGSRVGAGPAYAAPASISVLSGDVHHSYVARADFGTPVATAVYQLTCSPVHNQVPGFMRPLMRFSWSRAAARAVRGLAKSAGVRKPAWTWKRGGRSVLRERGQHAPAGRPAGDRTGGGHRQGRATCSRWPPVELR